MRMNKLLRALLAPFFMYAGEEDAGGGPASADAGVDWAALNDGVDPGADDDSDDGEAPAAAPTAAPARKASQAPSPAPAPADNPNSSTPDEDNADATPELDEDGNPIVTDPPEELHQEQTQTPEEQAAQAKQLQADFAKWEQAQIESLEKAYAFDEDTAARLQTEPELVLPKIAAQLHMDVLKRVVQTVTQMVPQMVQPVLRTQDVEKKAADFFYGKNPDLKKHHEQVLIAGQMFRKMNPKATAEEAAEKIGNIVRQSLGLAAVEGGQKPAATPAGRQKPHRPAGAGGGSGTRPAPAAKKQANDAGVDWSELLDD